MTLSWADLEIDDGAPALEIMARPSALAIAAQRAPQARRVVCRVCGRPWVDDACSFMPEQHARWGATLER
jgi:hypothetical protein